MIGNRLVLLAAAVTASAQVHLQYLDLGPQPMPYFMITDANGNAYVAGSFVTAVTNGANSAEM